MATRLTGFSKLVITLAILAVIFFGVRYLLNNTKMGQDLKQQAEVNKEKTDNATPGNTSANRDPNTLKIQLVSWGGYAPGLYFNEGAAANTNSRQRTKKA